MCENQREMAKKGYKQKKRNDGQTENMNNNKQLILKTEQRELSITPRLCGYPSEICERKTVQLNTNK